MSEKSRELHNKWLEARDKWLDYYKEREENEKNRQAELAKITDVLEQIKVERRHDAEREKERIKSKKLKAEADKLQEEYRERKTHEEEQEDREKEHYKEKLEQETAKIKTMSKAELLAEKNKIPSSSAKWQTRKVELAERKEKEAELQEKIDATKNGTKENDKYRRELKDLKEQWREQDHKDDTKNHYIYERENVINERLREFAKDENEKRKKITKPLSIVACIALVIAGIALIANNIQETNRKKDPLDLKGYPLSYVCGSYAKGIKYGSSRVKAKTLADAKAGKGDEVIDGVTTTDYPIDCENYSNQSHDKVWDYYVITYNQGDAGRWVYLSLIVGTKQEALAEGVEIREGY